MFAMRFVGGELDANSKGDAVTPFTVLILICSMSIDHAACQPDTARASVQGPHVASEMECGQLGQVTIAQTAAEVRPEPGKEYMKIVCSRTGSANAHKTANMQ